MSIHHGNWGRGSWWSSFKKQATIVYHMAATKEALPQP